MDVFKNKLLFRNSINQNYRKLVWREFTFNKHHFLHHINCIYIYGYYMAAFHCVTIQQKQECFPSMWWGELLCDCEIWIQINEPICDLRQIGVKPFAETERLVLRAIKPTTLLASWRFLKYNRIIWPQIIILCTVSAPRRRGAKEGENKTVAWRELVFSENYHVCIFTRRVKKKEEGKVSKV